MADFGIIAALAILSVVLIALNGFCIYTVLNSSTLRLPSTCAIASLLFCHLVQGTIVIPSYIVKRLDIPNPSVSGPACDVFRLSYLTTNYVSCLTLLLISVDRMCAILRPLRYKTSVTNQKICFAVMLVWFYVIILCALPFIPQDGPSGRCKYRPQKEWTIAMLSFNTLLPFILIFLCYVVIFKTARSARQKRRTMSVYVTKQNEMREIAAEFNIAKVSIAVIVTFAFCWGPSFFYYFLTSVCPHCFAKTFNDSRAEEILTFVMKFLTFVDGIIAPVIYCLKHKGFKRRILFNRRRLIWPASEIIEANRIKTISIENVDSNRSQESANGTEKAFGLGSSPLKKRRNCEQMCEVYTDVWGTETLETAVEANKHFEL